jgi:hypothetical protein
MTRLMYRERVQKAQSMRYKLVYAKVNTYKLVDVIELDQEHTNWYTINSPTLDCRITSWYMPK